MRNKMIITHPSEEHTPDLREVIWSGKDQGVDAIWISEDGKVSMLQAKQFRQVGFWEEHNEHIVPAWLTVPHHGKAEHNDQCTGEPPKRAERLLELIPLKYREHLVGDLEELYREHLHEDGIQAAQRWYWRQVLLSLLPFVWTVIKEVAGLASLLKLIK